ncbi:MAG: hypothetical protein WD208_03545 [Dehalococcoidia bacterium]
MRPYALLAAIQLGVIFFFLLWPQMTGATSTERGLPTNDGWVYLQYGRNFAERGWFYWSQSGPAVAGPTSWLWTIALAGAHLTLIPAGVDPVLSAQILGLAFGFATAAILFHLVKRFIHSSYIAFGASAAFLLDPTFAFQQLSGQAGSLMLVFAVALVALSLERKQPGLLGVSIALAAWARPEGLALAVIGGAMASWRPLLCMARDLRLFESQIWRMAKIWGPFLVAYGTFSLYTIAVRGDIGSTGLAVRSDADQSGLLLIRELPNAVINYLGGLPWFQGIYSGLTSFILACVGTIALLATKKPAAMYLLIAGAALIYIDGTLIPLPDANWTFWSERRYFDAATPIVLIALAVGLATTGRYLLKYLRSDRRISTLRLRTKVDLEACMPVGVIALLTLAFLPAMLNVPGEWQNRRAELYRDIAGVERTYAAPARWMAENTAGEGLVAAGIGGAAAYLSGHEVLDVTGAQTHEFFGIPYPHILSTQRPEYVFAIPEDRYATSLPGAVMISEGTLPYVQVYKVDWSLVAESPADPVVAAPLGDQLGYFELADGQQSAAHNHNISRTDFLQQLCSTLIEKLAVCETGPFVRAPATESFTISAIAGNDLTLVLRHDAVIGGTASVMIDGLEYGEWVLTEGTSAITESAFTVPGEYITGNNVEIMLGWTKGVVPFKYWAFSATEREAAK